MHYAGWEIFIYSECGGLNWKMIDSFWIRMSNGNINYWMLETQMTI